MTGPDLLRRRTELGISLDELAEVLGEHADQVQGYERVPGKLPAQLAVRLEYALAWNDREKRLNATGLTACAELGGIFAGMEGGKRKELERRIELAKEHALTCERCQARDAMIKTLPPLPPAPMPATARFLVALHQRIQELPGMARPAAWGAVIVGGFAMVRVLFYWLAHPARSLQAIGITLAAIGLGAYGGAVGGVAYSITRPRTRRFGRLGDYLTGLACSFAFLLAFVIPVNLFTNDNSFTGTTNLVISAVVALIFGLIIGHSGFKSQDGKAQAG